MEIFFMIDWIYFCIGN